MRLIRLTAWPTSHKDDLGWPNLNKFDVIHLSEVLEHVPNFREVLKECYRILKPGAVMLISVPSYLPESLCWMYSKEYMQTPGGHIRIFKKDFLRKKGNQHTQISKVLLSGTSLSVVPPSYTSFT